MAPELGSTVNSNAVVESDEPEFVEKDPTGRYVRFAEVLGKGAFKTVYRGFDEVNGTEVAWNRVKINDVLKSPEGLEKLYSEVRLLKTLKHENIIKLFDSWVDDKKKTVNMITELFTSGNLREYRKKHKNVDMKAVKNWARQILQGLAYLHSHDPPVIHRDLKCDNIFINGNHGEVKIGDLGLATVMQQPTAHSVIGTPEFMAPELYDEEYNELADIYSFGMCLLEMVTFEYPYSECKNPAQIFKKVTSGIKPAALTKVKDPKTKEFIERCLLPASERLPAKELLKDSFLQVESRKDPIKHPVDIPNQTPKLATLTSAPHSIDSCSYHWGSTSIDNSCFSPTDHVLEFMRAHNGNMFYLRGMKNHDNNSISFTLRILDPFVPGEAEKIDFVFYIETDTAIAVAAEMVEILDLADRDVSFIADFIDYLVKQITQDLKSSPVHSSVRPWKQGDNSVYAEDSSIISDKALGSLETLDYCIDDSFKKLSIKSWKQGGNSVCADDSSIIIYDKGLGKSLETLDYCIDDSLKESSVRTWEEGGNSVYAEDSSLAFDKALGSLETLDYCVIDDSFKKLSVNEPDPGDLYCEHDVYKFQRNDSNVSGYTHLNELTKNSDSSNSTEHGGLCCFMSLPSSSSSSGLNDEEVDAELKAELSAIETKYQLWFEDLARLREQSLEAAKKKWMMKKKMAALLV